jgi:hypothetical protein
VRERERVRQRERERERERERNMITMLTHKGNARYVPFNQSAYNFDDSFIIMIRIITKVIFYKSLFFAVFVCPS